jgi:CheY-like chemotaxis protein
MPLLLILEDTPAELQKAVEIAQRAGFTKFETSPYATRAHRYLEKASEGRVPLPDAMVIDIDLGIENGFELVRFWHSTERLKKIPLIVWSVMEDQREICELFGVYRLILKYEGPDILKEALAKLIADSAAPES